MGEENEKVDYIRQDMLSLSNEMKQGFRNLEQKIDNLRVQFNNDYKEMSNNCSQRRQKIYEHLNVHDKAIEKLDKKFFRLFLIGNGLGFIVGVIVTVIISKVV